MHMKTLLFAVIGYVLAASLYRCIGLRWEMAVVGLISGTLMLVLMERKGASGRNCASRATILLPESWSPTGSFTVINDDGIGKPIQPVSSDLTGPFAQNAKNANAPLVPVRSVD